ncbi:HXXEE domain-containing protein [Paenibacillus soyae]|uniref:HXXEE domain-containing protein n=1 Tax=Paenibacillus soyae TaxID=2969249 RepID=UPI0035304B5D
MTRLNGRNRVLDQYYSCLAGFPHFRALVNIGFGLLIVIFSLMNCATHIYTGVKYREWNPGLVMASLQFIASTYGAYIITAKGISHPLIWWISSVIFSILVHAILFKFVMNKK